MIIRLHTIIRLAAGILLMLAASLSLRASVVITTNQLRFYLDDECNSAQLTYLAYDSTNVSAYSGSIDVPASIEVSGKQVPVSGVSSLACVYCAELTSVSLPEGLTHIGFGAFSDCPKLSSITLPASLTSIGDWAFYHDAVLSAVQLPASVSRVGACSFGFCSSIVEQNLPEGLQAIAQNAFYYCQSLRQLTIPRSVDQIGEFAFAYCSSLQQITMQGAPIAITPDVFEGVDVTKVQLIVPSEQLVAYQTADVWRDFLLVDGGSGLPDTESSSRLLYSMYIDGGLLHVTPLGDAPVLVYDLSGKRIAVAATHSGEALIPLSQGTYIVRCGKESRKISASFSTKH